MTFSEWVSCRLLRRHPAFYLAVVSNSRIQKVPRKSRARSGNVLICVQCGGVA